MSSLVRAKVLRRIRKQTGTRWLFHLLRLFARVSHHALGCLSAKGESTWLGHHWAAGILAGLGALPGPGLPGSELKVWKGAIIWHPVARVAIEAESVELH